MKCLSIQQPWAQYIAAGIKDIENRTWELKSFPQRVLIHTGKKKQFESTDELPLLYQLIIENAERLGIVPFIEDMPTGAIIGVVDIVDCTTNDVASSDWAATSEDPDHPIYNFHLANARLFKNPILNVKGKQGIFEYSELDENNLPESVEIPTIRREGKELFIPLDDDEVDDFIEMDEALTFDHNLLNQNLHYFAEIKDDEIVALPTEYISFFNGAKSVRVSVESAVIEYISDEEGNDIIFSNPQGDELVWAKIFYSVLPERCKKSPQKEKPVKKALNDALDKLNPSCKNIIAALESAGYAFEYHKDPDSPYAEISTEIDDTGEDRLDADFIVNLETGVVTLTLYTENRVPIKSIKKAIENVNIFNGSASPAWLIINPENGAVCSRVCDIASDKPLTVNAAGSMVAYAIQAITEGFHELLQ